MRNYNPINAVKAIKYAACALVAGVFGGCAKEQPASSMDIYDVTANMAARERTSIDSATEKFFDGADRNRSGVVSQKELTAFMRRNPEAGMNPELGERGIRAFWDIVEGRAPAGLY